MSIKTKIAAIALAAVATVGSLTLTTRDAQAGHNGLAIGLGFATGALLASSAYGYSSGYGYTSYRHCFWTTRYDAYGYPFRTRVCSW